MSEAYKNTRTAAALDLWGRKFSKNPLNNESEVTTLAPLSQVTMVMGVIVVVHVSDPLIPVNQAIYNSKSTAVVLEQWERKFSKSVQNNESEVTTLVPLSQVTIMMDDLAVVYVNAALICGQWRRRGTGNFPNVSKGERPHQSV